MRTLVVLLSAAFAMSVRADETADDASFWLGPDEIDVVFGARTFRLGPRGAGVFAEVGAASAERQFWLGPDEIAWASVNRIAWLGPDEIAEAWTNRTFVLGALSFPLLGASVSWSEDVSEGKAWAQLSLAVTNGEAAAVTDVRYVFQDRSAQGVRLLGERALSGTGFASSATWRFVELSAADAAYAALTNGQVATWGEKQIGLMRENGVLGATEAAGYLGWVAWSAGGRMRFVPVGGGADLLMALGGVFDAPLSVEAANAALAFGRAARADGSDPVCAIAAFAVADGKIVGRVELLGEDGAANPPGGNVTATLLGTADLADDFTSCGEVTLAADGSFAVSVPDGLRFFRLRLEVVPLIK